MSVPADLVAQRPDVRQAEADLHAASAKIGIAVANRLPNITLTANTGSSASAINQLFTSGTGFWSVGADLTAPIFQGGALLHQERAAKAAYVQAAAQYRSTVLTACQNVADTLAALAADAEGLKAAATAADAAKTTLDLAQRQWQDGYAGYLALLSARASLSAGADQPGAGPGQPLRRHGGAVSGSGRRLVAPAGSRRGRSWQITQGARGADALLVPSACSGTRGSGCSPRRQRLYLQGG